jgi:hypothetical protein
MLRFLLKQVTCDFEPTRFADTRKAVIAAELARVTGTEPAEGTAAPAAAPAAAANPFLAAFQAIAGAQAEAEPEPEVASKQLPRARQRKPKVTEEAAPSQPLPSEVPANVDTTLVTPRKRAPRKKVVA